MKTKRKNLQNKLLIKDHFREMIKRFYYWIFFFVVGSVFGYLNYETILKWLILPLNRPLFYTSPTGGFEAVFGISILVGLVLSLPVLIFQIVKFIEPANKNIKLMGSRMLMFFLSSLFLASVGIIISYYIVFPASLTFLSKFGGHQLESLISTKEYFSFITKYLIGFAVLFQLPLIIYLASFFTQITPKLLMRQFKYVFAASFIIAAILTPTPDFINQVTMAVPLILLYLVTIIILQIKKIVVK